MDDMITVMFITTYFHLDLAVMQHRKNLDLIEVNEDCQTIAHYVMVDFIAMRVDTLKNLQILIPTVASELVKLLYAIEVDFAVVFVACRPSQYSSPIIELIIEAFKFDNIF
jgi:hypothetical protein